MAVEITDSAQIRAEQKFVRLLERDYKEVEFRWGQPRFSYRLKNGKKVVFLGEPQPNFGLLALHELGHALCEHKDYNTHVERLKIESEAWEMAKTVYSNYATNTHLADILPEWNEDIVQEKLDTYREWLHNKSLCKKCGLTMYQTKDGKYHCPRCESFL